MVKFVKKFNTGCEKLCWAICYVSMIIVAVLMVVMFIDAMLGLVFNYRLSGAYELEQQMLCILVFTSWAYTQTQHGHIHVVMFVRMFPQKVRFVIFSLTSLISVITMFFGCIGVWRMIQDKISNGEATPILLIPFWPFYLVEFISFIILTVALFADFLRSVCAIADKETAEEVMSTWT